MPIIITAHIANSSAWWVKSHLVAIIQAALPVIGPYMSDAIDAIQPQHKAITTAKVAPTSHRSRTSWSLFWILVMTLPPLKRRRLRPASRRFLPGFLPAQGSYVEQ